MRAIIVAGAWGVVLAGVGCSSQPVDGAGDSGQFIPQLCAEFAGCCTAAGLPVDDAECRKYYTTITPAAGIDQAEADACLQELRGLGADECAWSSSATPSCERVFAENGTAKPGEVCENDEDCALSAEGEVQCVQSVIDDTVVVQQCELILPGVEGSSPCVGTMRGSPIEAFQGSGAIPAEGYVCDVADGLTCNRQGRACTPLGAVGEDCNLGGDADCITSAYCDFNDGICKDRLPVGTACRNDWCEETAYCENEQTCVARRARGETCTNDAECANNSCVNGTCQASNDFYLVFLCGKN